MLLLKLPFSAFVQLTKNWITSPNIRLYQLQWDNYHHGIHKTLYFQNEIINQSCLWDWSKGKYLQDDSQSCLFSRGVGIFDLIFLRHFLTKMRSFCAHQKGNFLNFAKLTLLLSLVHSWSDSGHLMSKVFVHLRYHKIRPKLGHIWHFFFLW